MQYYTTTITEKTIERLYPGTYTFSLPKWPLLPLGITIDQQEQEKMDT